MTTITMIVMSSTGTRNHSNTFKHITMRLMKIVATVVTIKSHHKEIIEIMPLTVDTIMMIAISRTIVATLWVVPTAIVVVS